MHPSPTSRPRRDVRSCLVLLATAGASLLEVSLLFDGGSVFNPVLLLPLATLLVGEPLGTDGTAVTAPRPRASEDRAPAALPRG